MIRLSIFTVFAFAFLLSGTAIAQQRDTDQDPAAWATQAARTGVAAPLVLSASLGAQRAIVIGSGGYDGARKGAIFDSAAEVRVWGPIALRAGVIYGNDVQRMRPSAGARVQLLRQAAHGVDGSFGGFFKTEGFNEMEGEVEAVFSLGRRFEHFYLLGNVAYGQDPEGRERDGEVRASALVPYGRAVWGLQSQTRFAIGPQNGLHSAVEPRFDAGAGALGMVSLSSFVLFAQLGPSAFRLQGADIRWGVAGVAGVTAVF
jgi:hypothetical protein